MEGILCDHNYILHVPLGSNKYFPKIKKCKDPEKSEEIVTSGVNFERPIIIKTNSDGINYQDFVTTEIGQHNDVGNDTATVRSQETKGDTFSVNVSTVLRDQKADNIIMDPCDDSVAEEIEKCISQFTQTIEENIDSLVDFPSLTALTRSKQKIQQPTEKPVFTCGECGKDFKYKHHLKVHMKVHIPDKPFSCDFCEKKFSLKHHYTQHIRVHTGEKPYKCEVCERCFLSSSNLKRHFDTHVLKVVRVDDDEMFLQDRDPNHACEVCDRKFNRIDHLKRHIQIHSGELEFKCDICGKEFNRKYHLTRHQKTKCGSKYSCPVCKKRYKSKRNFDLHIQSHENDEDFACEDEISEEEMSEDQLSDSNDISENKQSISDNVFVKEEVVDEVNVKKEISESFHSIKVEIDEGLIKIETDDKLVKLTLNNQYNLRMRRKSSK